MNGKTPQKTVPELVEYPLSNLCVTSIGAAIFILTLIHADVIGDQSDAVTQNAWFRWALCAAIGEISIGPINTNRVRVLGKVSCTKNLPLGEWQGRSEFDSRPLGCSIMVITEV